MNAFEVVLIENVINDVLSAIMSGKLIERKQWTDMIELQWCVLDYIKIVQGESKKESISRQ